MVCLLAKLGLSLFVLAAASGACSDPNDGTAEQDTLSRRQRDSLVGELPIPGAKGVHRAMEAADSAEARRRMLDSIGG